MYPIAEIKQFDVDFRMQLHFNFSTTRTTQKQTQALDATRASRLRDVDLDALPENTSTSASKYLEAYHEQLDCLLRNNQYSRLEEVRRNRCVRTYHGRTGKMALAHDEWLELNNKEFAMYPSVKTLDSMSRQGQFIGVTQKATRFTLQEQYWIVLFIGVEQDQRVTAPQRRF